MYWKNFYRKFLVKLIRQYCGALRKLSLRFLFLVIRLFSDEKINDSGENVKVFMQQVVYEIKIHQVVS